jgi:DnaK suppressor protein
VSAESNNPRNKTTARESEFRGRLQAELEELTALREASSETRSAVELDQQSVGRLSRVDALQTQQMALAADRSRQARIQLIRQALERIKSGEFGYCLVCDEPIAQGRLNADPSTPVCVNCAAQRAG